MSLETDFAALIILLLTSEKQVRQGEAGDGSLPHRRKLKINEKTEISVNMEYKSVGKNNKIGYIYFTVDTNPNVVEAPKEEKKDVSFDELLAMISKASSLTRGMFSLEEYKSFLEVAEYDISKIEKAFSVLNATKKVDNATMFMIQAIKEGWDVPKFVRNDPSYSSHMTAQYDFNALNKMIEEN